MSRLEGQITSIDIKDISQVDQRVQFETSTTKLSSTTIISHKGEKALYIAIHLYQTLNIDQKMEVVIKDDVEVSKKGEIKMDVEGKSIWEVSL